MDGLFGSFGIIGFIFSIVMALVIILMPFYVISINNHVRHASVTTEKINANILRIRNLEYARFMMHLRHGDVTLSELDGVWRSGLVSKEEIERVAELRKQDESNKQ